MAEATNELAFMVTGAYGKPVAKAMGAPLRLHLPWKYGFKSIKSIVKFTFTDERPVSFWEQLQPSEYGFWANVNPEVPHPRWSQAMERDIGTQEFDPDPDLQRLWRIRRRPLYRHDRRAALHVVPRRAAAPIALRNTKSRALAGPAVFAVTASLPAYAPEGNR